MSRRKGWMKAVCALALLGCSEGALAGLTSSDDVPTVELATGRSGAPGAVNVDISSGPFTAGVDATDRCTQRDAYLLFNNWSGAVLHGLREGHRSRPADAFRECQYRLYLDGETIYFQEGEVILGGVNVYWPFALLDAMGATRTEAIADLEATTARVWLARLDADGSVGEFVEQVLLRTPYREGVYPEGRVLHQHRAFVTMLEAGQYLSLFRGSWEEFYGYPSGELSATVRLVVLP